ncbi:hypothetical protein Golomagni_05632 [Golovinomyces magnicellulatus]|nr:hypothetical protein Golomagni_05632 [Golovinomyces magnicellulatus]
MDFRAFVHRESRQHVADAYSSARLRYAKLSAKDERLVSLTREGRDDPVLAGLDNLKYTAPVAPEEIEEMLHERQSSLLEVAILLPPTEKHPTGEVIGSMGLGGAPDKRMFACRRATFGIYIAKDHQRKGYGREATNWLLDWGFSQAGLHTIALKTNSFNEGAIELYKAVGFVEEGREREVRYLNRKWYDVVLFSMTEDEWERLRADAEH